MGPFTVVNLFDMGVVLAILVWGSYLVWPLVDIEVMTWWRRWRERRRLRQR